ncbi:Root adhesin [Jannaschia seosinensis]|uniref:Root adhesin n=1 Tax=Jannaschia seosinensis TaxID=313367 RepID=A0A0M7B9E2_9RHOB|nr:OmpA family protein [Jannaschia seosinensis]CUH38314.1 Root adhesin [Jannaschia seosinensis]
MSRKFKFASIAAFALAAAAAAGGAWFGADFVEERSRAAVTATFSQTGIEWADAQTDGLQLILTGTAPDEPSRFRAVTAAGSVVDPGRIVDAMQVVPREGAVAPRFSLEILRNKDDVSLIGLVPARDDDLLDTLLDRTARAEFLEIVNMVERADHPVADSWDETLRFALSTLSDLHHAKVSVEPGRVAVTAVADSDEEKIRLERELSRLAPSGVALRLDIAAPRPVITPFTLRYVIPPDGTPRFEACAVDSLAAEARIVAAARETGFEGRADCVLGLGVPSASWGEAAAEGIAALGRVGGGSLTLSDADVSLVAQEGADPDRFETEMAELKTALPDLFVLSAVLPEPTKIDGTGENEAGTPEFVATLSPEGQVQLRGRLYDEAQAAAVLSYGRARFGVSKTYIATREDPTLPRGWPGRVLAALDALSRLNNGVVIVQPDLVVVRGVTGEQRAGARISGLLGDKLGAEANFRIDVSYDEELDPLLNIPTPRECEEQLNAILTEQKLTFAPGADVIEAAGDGQLAKLRAKLDECARAVFEIGGHTDSQGSEGGNLALSLRRAEAVRAALIARGARPGQMVAKGYGEAQPVADNATEAGREENRRITFVLLGRRDEMPEAEVEAPTEAPSGDVDTTLETATEDAVPSEEDGS